MHGTVTRIVSDRGFGFLRCNGEDYFFHRNDLDPQIAFDEQLLERRVRFDALQAERGPRAKNVRAAD